MPSRTPVLDVFRPAIRAACRAYFRLDLRGTEHIPAQGGLVIVPNHQTYADPPLVTIPVRRPVYYMAWSRLFDIPVFGGLIRLLRAFPVDIESRDARATREAVRLLQSGEALMIFPEGERTVDGHLRRFKPGAFRLAVSLNVPVLPVTIVGGHDAWPPGRAFPRPRPITITYHPVLHPDPTLDPRPAAQDLAIRTRTAILSAMPAAEAAAAAGAATSADPEEDDDGPKSNPAPSIDPATPKRDAGTQRPVRDDRENTSGR